MGNCQAVDAAALVIQHPCGKVERMYWSVAASEVMKANPGHYVSLIIPLTTLPHTPTVRVKLLRPTDNLLLGRAYRLLTTQDVIKVLTAKKHAKMKRTQLPSDSESHNTANHHRPNIAGGRPNSWRPSLQSISESPCT